MHKMVISCLAVRQTGILLYFVRQSPVIYTYIKFKFCLFFFFRKTTLFKLSCIMHKCIIYRKQIIEYIYINEKVIISVKIAITLKVTYNCLLKLLYIVSASILIFTLPLL